MLESAIAAGVTAAGGDALLGRRPADAGGTAARAPARARSSRRSSRRRTIRIADNGIKLFAADGYKLDDDSRARDRSGARASCRARGADRPRAPHARRAGGLPARAHRRFAGLDLSGKRILLDCANGATYQAAPEIFRRLGADVVVLADQPDGRNINDGCGSTHLGLLGATITSGEFDIGFAFDGDGDRVLAVDRDRDGRRWRRTDRTCGAAPARARAAWTAAASRSR